MQQSNLKMEFSAIRGIVNHLGDYNAVYGETLKLVRAFQPRYHPNMDCDHEDLAMELIAKWLQNGYLDAYDGETSTPTHYLRVGIRNHLISAERKVKAVKRGEARTISGDVQVKSSDGEEGATIFDLVADDKQMCALDLTMLRDSLNQLQKRHSWGREIISPLTKEPVQLSHFTIVYHHLAGYTMRELGAMFNVSNSRISMIYDEAIKHMRARA